MHIHLLTCTTPRCDRAPYARGLCQRHYARMRRLGLLPDLGPTLIPLGPVPAAVLGMGRVWRVLGQGRGGEGR